MSDSITATTYEAWAPNYDEWNSVNSYTVAGIEHLVASKILSSLPPGRVLDAACGTGRWAKYMRGLGWDAYMVDQSLPMLTRVRPPTGSNDLHVPILSTLEALPFLNESFDLVLCAFALLHIKNLALAIGEIARVTSKHGIVMISDIHPSLQREWGQEKKIAICGVFYPFPCFHHTIQKYRSHASHAGLKLVAEYQLKALIDGQIKKAVLLFFFNKVGGLPNKRRYSNKTG